MEAGSTEGPKEKRISYPVSEVIFFIALLACVTPFISPPAALIMGLVIANVSGHPYLHFNQKATQRLLQVSVVGLGFGINVQNALQAGREGFLYTLISIGVTLILGYLIGRWLKIENKTSQLISCGTAICGGSAIAAMSPVLKAEAKQISIALGTVFILNSISLLVFPLIGNYLDLSQKQFGIWAAIAIHDTSSVVGAAHRFGAEALQIATTVKLARALWIVPMVLLTSFLIKEKTRKVKIPWFIGFFIVAMFLSTYVGQVSIAAPYIVSAAKTGLTITLFLIGAGLNKQVIRSVGIAPLLQGLLLWIFISVTTLLAVLNFS